MASPNSPYGMFVASPDTSYGSSRLSPGGPTPAVDIRKVIDGLLDTAMNRIKVAHEQLMSSRTSLSGPDYQPYVGVANHIQFISGTLSELTTALTQESMMNDASDFFYTQSARYELANLSAITGFGNDKVRLKQIQNLTTQYDRSVRGTSEHSQSVIGYPDDNTSPKSNHSHRAVPGPASPISVQSLSSGASPTGLLGSPEGRSRLPNQPQPRASRETSPPALSDKDHFANYNLDRWKKRGKDTGNYCPRKWDCKKGGVVNGQLVLFERNSAYIQHCNKHKRPFVCELPGCPNPIQRRNFARADGLRRHQELVTHGVPCQNNNNIRQRTSRPSTGSQEPRTPSSRPYLKPEYDFSDPGPRDSGMGDTLSVKIDTG
jgi:hypothetical protein